MAINAEMMTAGSKGTCSIMASVAPAHRQTIQPWGQFISVWLGL